MPPVGKIARLPDELRKALARELEETGGGDIIEITRRLNEWIAAEGINETVGKTAVGKYAQMLKMQQAAMEAAEVMTQEMGIEGEAKMHKAIMQMLAGETLTLMTNAREKAKDDEDGTGLSPIDMMRLAKMLKDLMASAGIREKLTDDQEARVARRAREASAKIAETVAAEQGLSREVSDAFMYAILNMKPPAPEAAAP